jgi:hypothetical protein
VTALGRQFDPHKLAYGEEVTVDPEEFAAHPDIRRDERDPRLGGRGAPFRDDVMDEMVPEHGMELKYANLPQEEIEARRQTSLGAWSDYRAGKITREEERSVAEANSLTTLDNDSYIDAIGNSMAAVGQQEPGILFSDPMGQKPYWLGEGNHRLAAARRTGQPFRVKRRDKS